MAAMIRQEIIACKTAPRPSGRRVSASHQRLPEEHRAFVRFREMKPPRLSDQYGRSGRLARLELECRQTPHARRSIATWANGSCGPIPGAQNRLQKNATWLSPKVAVAGSLGLNRPIRYGLSCACRTRTERTRPDGRRPTGLGGGTAGRLVMLLRPAYGGRIVTSDLEADHGT